MADEKQLAILEQGVDVWNRWRDEHCGVKVDLSGVDLSYAYLAGAALHGVNFSNTDLSNATLSGAILGSSNFTGANLSFADLSKANIDLAIFLGTNLRSTYFTNEAQLYSAEIGNCILDTVKFDE